MSVYFINFQQFLVSPECFLSQVKEIRQLVASWRLRFHTGWYLQHVFNDTPDSGVLQKHMKLLWVVFGARHEGNGSSRDAPPHPTPPPSSLGFMIAKRCTATERERESSGSSRNRNSDCAILWRNRKWAFRLSASYYGRRTFRKWCCGMSVIRVYHENGARWGCTSQSLLYLNSLYRVIWLAGSTHQSRLVDLYFRYSLNCPIRRHFCCI